LLLVSLPDLLLHMLQITYLSLSSGTCSETFPFYLSPRIKFCVLLDSNDPSLEDLWALRCCAKRSFDVYFLQHRLLNNLLNDSFNNNLRLRLIAAPAGRRVGPALGSSF
jgi:hypothetical protein